jgi:hypothetical protein
MKLSKFKESLVAHQDAHVRFRLPSGDLSPAHAHVTEVARISKRFIDCGGTLREDSSCRLQTWVADDFEHWLAAGKLAKILDKAASFLGQDDLEVDVEHDVGFVTQFPVEGVDIVGNELIIRLQGRHTACLAPELCCPPQPPTTVVSLGRKK